MICPRCSNRISDNETICPFCHGEIFSDIEFNDYKEDGFVRLKLKNDSEGKTNKKIRRITDDSKYLKTTRYLMVISIVFLLVIAVVTIFGYKALQYFTNDTPADMHVAPYVPSSDNDEDEMHRIKNSIKKVSVEHLHGSWKSLDAIEQKKSAIPYFSFAEDGAAQYDYGSFSVYGYFKDYSTKNKNTVYIEIDNQLCGLYAFDVTGNKKDGYRLALKNTSSGMTHYFESAEAKTYKLKPVEGGTIEKKLVGTWECRDGNRNYKFYSDGRFERQVGNQVMTGVWCEDTLRDNAITIKYMERVVADITLSYTLYDDSLLINDMVYYKK